MQIRRLKIKNFRGISTLDWKPNRAFCCLIGPGDSGKSTVLDAVEAALSSRWFSFTEPDFLGCNTSNAIEIEATIGELSRALKSDERFGLYIRGWTVGGELHDEPEDDDEPVLTVRLTVDSTMEPAWEMVCDRMDTPRTLSNRDRALFGLVRLAGEDTRQLAWGQGSVLSKLTGDSTEAAIRLAEAYRSARDSAKLGEIEALATAASLAEGFAKSLGAYVEGAYEPGLELGRSGLSSGSIALHDTGVPLRLAGLGTRRLATLAIQKSAIVDGAIVLVDEIEHGLEPHRIIGAISQLKADQTASVAAGKPVGQVFMTTHSDVALAEAGGENLHVVSIERPGRAAMVMVPASPEAIRPLLRFTPRALFARRILVCEGYTEVGMLLGLREHWPSRHGNKPIEQQGAAITDGNGAQASAMAMALTELGFHTAIYRDSDDPLTADQIAKLALYGIPVFEYGSGLNTEQAMFSAASNDQVQELLEYARSERGEDFVNNNIATKINENIDTVKEMFNFWDVVMDLDGAQLREAIAEVAAGKGAKDKKDKKPWFKDQRIGRGLAPIVWNIAAEAPKSPIAIALAQAEAWLYA
ncbi:AAA family ATPase [Rhodoferax ferrireducens]|uniref:ATP-dependent nuclease n=1 Tax=Rhodoferax ferrireducens TaxID=192843 RepID=UPI00298EC2E2|nr:AAA family ATPase [Rhodoferax ferrireducens]WPC68000.1 AAA family ATPase [Rhodoferax ferrireducens]